MLLRAVLILALLAIPAMAQEPSVADLQRALGIFQAQRNAAMDAAANAEFRAATLAEQITKLRAELDELKKATAVPAK